MVGGGGIKGSVKGGCWRSWWGNKGQCERWVLEVMLGGGGGGGSVKGGGGKVGGQVGKRGGCWMSF